MQVKDIWKHTLEVVLHPEANIWAQEGLEWGRRGLQNEEFHSMYCSPNIVRVIKTRWLRWVGQVARMGSGSAFNILADKLTGKRPLGRSRYRWENILEWILEKWVSIQGIGLIRLRMRIIAEPLDSISNGVSYMWSLYNFIIWILVQSTKKNRKNTRRRQKKW